MALRFRNTKTGENYSREDVSKWIKQRGEETYLWPLYNSPVEEFRQKRQEFLDDISELEKQVEKTSVQDNEEKEWTMNLSHLNFLIKIFNPDTYQRMQAHEKIKYRDEHAEKVAETLDSLHLSFYAPESRVQESSRNYLSLCKQARRE